MVDFLRLCEEGRKEELKEERSIKTFKQKLTRVPDGLRGSQRGPYNALPGSWTPNTGRCWISWRWTTSLPEEDWGFFWRDLTPPTQMGPSADLVDSCSLEG